VEFKERIQFPSDTPFYMACKRKSLHYCVATEGEFKIVRFAKVPIDAWFRSDKSWFYKQSENRAQSENGINLILFSEKFVGLNIKYFDNPYM
jgi:hypothetical protein